MMEKSRLAEIVEKNPKIDRTAIDRSEQAVKQLADVGIKVGGYRLAPALGGKMIRNPGQPIRQGGNL
ncbi:hypothetical protein [Candidatus Palauibacter sp.]|uniref:hypothetical protein n=1 Tax=Candidatus Palauibacter sp. TaxID=3101350 RepID=UPI003B5CF1A3